LFVMERARRSSRARGVPDKAAIPRRETCAVTGVTDRRGDRRHRKADPRSFATTKGFRRKNGDASPPRRRRQRRPAIARLDPPAAPRHGLYVRVETPRGQGRSTSSSAKGSAASPTAGSRPRSSFSTGAVFPPSPPSPPSSSGPSRLRRPGPPGFLLLYEEGGRGRLARATSTLRSRPGVRHGRRVRRPHASCQTRPGRQDRRRRQRDQARQRRGDRRLPRQRRRGCSRSPRSSPARPHRAARTTSHRDARRADEAQDIHGLPIEACAGADVVTALTMTDTPEAIGILRAAGAAGVRR